MNFDSRGCQSSTLIRVEDINDSVVIQVCDHLGSPE